MVTIKKKLFDINLKNKKIYELSFKKKVVVITGASMGIGFEISKQYLLHGADLMVCSSNLLKIKKAYKKLLMIKKKDQRIFYLKVDVSSEAQIKKLIKYTIKKFKKIDILINNAGIYGPKGFIENIDWQEWVKTIKINLLGPVLLCKEVIPYFKKRNQGKIIQLSGGGAAAPLPMISGYATSKAGIVRFIETFSEEVKDYNIQINSVAPGAINTGMLREVLKAGPKKIGEKAYKKALLQKKLGGSSLKDACDLILFLGSKNSNGISGKLISAIWDDWKIWPKYKSILSKSDLFTLRRIIPRDRGVKIGKLKNNLYDKSLMPKK